MKTAVAILASILVTASSAANAGEPLMFGPTLSDGAVLQRGKPIELSGRAIPKAIVEVEFGGSKQRTNADREGRWSTTFAAMDATSGLTVVATSEGQRLQLQNIAVGDVFLCSGQSNMAFSMAETALNAGERKLSIDRNISLLLVPKGQARVEQATFTSGVSWTNAHDGSEKFSAVCMIAGRAIAQAQKIPVGLIDASLGGTPIESWLPYDGIKRAGGLEQGIAILDAFRSDPTVAEERWGKQLDAMWKMPPPPGQDPDRPRLGYANLFNAMVAPLGRMPLAGVMWYQGENNTRRANTRAAYVSQLKALLASWRSRFGQQLPFVIVQLAPFGPLASSPDENNWAELREAQRLVATEDPWAELVTTVDVGERLDIHPPLKKPVGQRAAAALSHLLYGGPIEALGPLPLEARRNGGEIRVRVGNATEGLMAASWGRPGPFILCRTKPERDCRFADARLIDADVAVDLAPGFNPDIVRYCWGAAPICNVFDRKGRPLAPFELNIPAGQ